MQRSGSTLAITIAILALAVALIGRPGMSTAHAALDDSADAPPRIAVVASIRLMNDLMDSDRFKPARDDAKQALEDEIAPIVDQGRALEEGLRAMDPNSDEARKTKQQLLTLQGMLARKQQEVGVRFEKLIAQQSREAYILIRDSAVAIAEKRGFNFLLASQNTDDEINEGPVAGLLNDILGRPVMLSPEANDITEDVRADLKLD